MNLAIIEATYLLHTYSTRYSSLKTWSMGLWGSGYFICISTRLSTVLQDMHQNCMLVLPNWRRRHTQKTTHRADPSHSMFVWVPTHHLILRLTSYTSHISVYLGIPFKLSGQIY